MALTLSLTPRKLTSATSSMKPSARPVSAAPPAAKSSSKPVFMKSAKAYDAVEAQVMPEHITVNATMKVRKCMPKALCV